MLIINEQALNLDKRKPRIGMTVNCRDNPNPRSAGIRVKTAVKSDTFMVKPMPNIVNDKPHVTKDILNLSREREKVR